MAGRLSDDAHDLMDMFLEQIFEDIRAGALEKTAFVETIALVVTAIDIGAHDEALRYFKEKAKTSRTKLQIVTSSGTSR